MRTHGSASEGLRILTDDVALVRGQWYVPYDGGEPHAYVPAGSASP